MIKKTIKQGFIFTILFFFTSKNIISLEVSGFECFVKVSDYIHSGCKQIEFKFKKDVEIVTMEENSDQKLFKIQFLAKDKKDIFGTSVEDFLLNLKQKSHGGDQEPLFTEVSFSYLNPQVASGTESEDKTFQVILRPNLKVFDMNIGFLPVINILNIRSTQKEKILAKDEKFLTLI